MICPMKFNAATLPDSKTKWYINGILVWAGKECEGDKCKWFPVCDKLLDLVDAILYPKLRIDKGGK